jgi:hypothetical protein
VNRLGASCSPKTRLEALSVAELWTVWRDAMDQLKDRGVLRSTGGPVGDYGEWLVARALGLTREKYPNPGFDAIAPDGTRYSVKARRWGRIKPPTRVALGLLDTDSFDRLVLVVFTDAMEVHRAVDLPIDTVRTLLLRDGRNTSVGRIFGAPEARDLTGVLRAVVP